MKFMNLNKSKLCGSIISIPCDSIVVNSMYIRKNIDNDELSLLSVSISNNGIIQPLLVRRIHEENRYELIAGLRRLNAAKAVGLNTVPCIVMSSSDRDSLIYSLTENIQREDLSFFEIADSLYILIHDFGMTQSELYNRLGKSQSWVSNKIRLTPFPDDIRETIIDNNLTERHARALLRLDDDNKIRGALHHIISKKLSVSETDKYIESILSPVKRKNKPKIKKLKDIKIFINTINHAVDTMRKAGINADSRRTETPDYYEYIVRIPKMTSSPVNLINDSDAAV